jgi:hypothetical protein
MVEAGSSFWDVMAKAPMSPRHIAKHFLKSSTCRKSMPTNIPKELSAIAASHPISSV